MATRRLQRMNSIITWIITDRKLPRLLRTTTETVLYSDTYRQQVIISSSYAKGDVLYIEASSREFSSEPLSQFRLPACINRLMAVFDLGAISTTVADVQLFGRQRSPLAYYWIFQAPSGLRRDAASSGHLPLPPPGVYRISRSRALFHFFCQSYWKTCYGYSSSDAACSAGSWILHEMPPADQMCETRFRLRP